MDTKDIHQLRLYIWFELTTKQQRTLNEFVWPTTLEHIDMDLFKSVTKKKKLRRAMIRLKRSTLHLAA